MDEPKVEGAVVAPKLNEDPLTWLDPEAAEAPKAPPNAPPKADAGAGAEKDAGAAGAVDPPNPKPAGELPAGWDGVRRVGDESRETRTVGAIALFFGRPRILRVESQRGAQRSLGVADALSPCDLLLWCVPTSVLEL